MHALKAFVRQWHEAALPVITTKPFEETWMDFVEGWQKVQFPAGEEPIAMIYQQALADGMPAVAGQYEQLQLQRLVALCRELQRASGEKSFFLAGRTAALLLDIPHTQVARWLRLLIVDEVLELRRKGKRHQASEYRYRGD